jgi:hypothetical protein
MTHVVYERERFDEIRIQVEYFGNGARDLRDLNGVCQSIAKMIGVAASEDLRFVFQPPKSPRVNNAIAITLEIIAIRMRRFRVASSARLFHVHRIGSEHTASLGAWGLRFKCSCSSRYLVGIR